jgi:hypothetical protein
VLVSVTVVYVNILPVCSTLQVVFSCNIGCAGSYHSSGIWCVVNWCLYTNILVALL